MAKTENTSQTFGQMIAFDDGSGLPKGKKLIAVKIANKDADLANIDLDAAKSQISIAAANKNTATQTLPTLSKNSPLFHSSIDGGAGAFIVTNGTAYVVASETYTNDALLKILKESRKVESILSMRSQDSDTIEFNNMQVPEMNLNFTYNFFTIQENSIETQEDPRFDPLISGSLQSTPMYVNLTWQPLSTVEQVKADTSQGTANANQIAALKQQTLATRRGIVPINGTTKKSFSSSNKKTSTLKKSGKTLTLTDIHGLDDAINSVSNDNVFTGVDVVLNVQNNTQDSKIKDVIAPTLQGREKK